MKNKPLNLKQMLQKWRALPPHKQALTLIVIPLFGYYFYSSVIVIAQPFLVPQETRHE